MGNFVGYAMIVGVVLGLVHVVGDYFRGKRMTEAERLKQEWRGW